MLYGFILFVSTHDNATGSLCIDLLLKLSNITLILRLQLYTYAYMYVQQLYVCIVDYVPYMNTTTQENKKMI